jgi:hypothetical protein
MRTRVVTIRRSTGTVTISISFAAFTQAAFVAAVVHERDQVHATLRAFAGLGEPDLGVHGAGPELCFGGLVLGHDRGSLVPIVAIVPGIRKGRRQPNAQEKPDYKGKQNGRRYAQFPPLFSLFAHVLLLRYRARSRHFSEYS